MQFSTVLITAAATLAAGVIASPAPVPSPDVATAAGTANNACSPGYSYCGSVLAQWGYASSEGPVQDGYLYLCNADKSVNLISKCPTQFCQGPVAHCA